MQTKKLYHVEFETEGNRGLEHIVAKNPDEALTLATNQLEYPDLIFIRVQKTHLEGLYDENY